MDLIKDLIKPIVRFLINSGLWKGRIIDNEEKIVFPRYLKIRPSEHLFKKGKSFINTFLFTNSKKRSNIA